MEFQAAHAKGKRERAQVGKLLYLFNSQHHICIFVLGGLNSRHPRTLIFIFVLDRLNSRHLSCQIESNGKEGAQM